MSEEGDDLPWGELDINHLPVPGQHQPVGLRQLADIQCSLKAVYSFHISYLSYTGVEARICKIEEEVG